MNEAAVLSAVRLLRAGKLVGLPTETVYGLAADAENPEAVAQIYRVKGRPLGHPLILHLGDATWLSRYCVDVPGEATLLTERYWPGPLSLILKRSARVLDEVTGGRETVAVRVPSHPLARRVLLELGRGIAAPSANRFGGVSPTTRAHVERDLGDDVALVLEGGPSEVGLESTIVDLSGAAPRLLRPGGISKEDLEATLGRPVLLDDGTGPAAPGTLESHYAPRAKVELVAEEGLRAAAERCAQTGRKAGVLSATPRPFELSSDVNWEQAGPTAEATAHELYAALRRLDEAGCAVIFASLPEATGLGRAVADRLVRAAADSDRR